MCHKENTGGVPVSPALIPLGLVGWSVSCWTGVWRLFFLLLETGSHPLGTSLWNGSKETKTSLVFAAI